MKPSVNLTEEHSMKSAASIVVLVILTEAGVVSAQSWAPQTSGTTASLRGIAAVNDRVAWASGTGGTYVVTTDGGATWKAGHVPGAEQLDFRDAHAVDERTAWLMSAGTGGASRIYRTTDGGAKWTLQFTNPDAAGFFDAIAFWDAKRGLIVGDSVDGRIPVFSTEDGGEHWRRREGPAALEKEGGFAASGTCLVVAGARDAWFATTAARVFHSTDGGATWTVVATPVRHDKPSSGIFSLAFRGAMGIAVGGDYASDKEDGRNVAITNDGGKTWTEPPSRPSGFRSAVAFTPAGLIAVGTSGSDLSTDGGKTWKRFDGGAYHAIGFPWVVGPKGAIAKYAP
jgi:photosystem II stability/assembly factor-like uncharacterized protein